MFLYDTPPCKNCQKRESGCHSTCKGYIDWKTDHENRRKKIQAELKTELDIMQGKIKQCENYRWKFLKKK